MRRREFITIPVFLRRLEDNDDEPASTAEIRARPRARRAAAPHRSGGHPARPITARLFHDAEIGPGMRVLNLGCDVGTRFVS